MSTTPFPHRYALALIAALALPVVALSQTYPTGGAGPIPRQIVAAKRMFLSNAGSESYRGDGSTDLSADEGGADRYYHQLYAALQEWGRYELVSAPTEADLVAEVRLVVASDERRGSNSVPDPQLKLTILDPTTHVALWSFTEHVEVSWRTASNERNFDQAVVRVVDRLKMLSQGSTRPPDSIIELRQRQQRYRNVSAGVFLGAVAGGAIAGRSSHNQCDVFAGCNPQTARLPGSNAF